MSTIVRRTLAVALLALVLQARGAHAQSTPPYTHANDSTQGNESEQGRLLQLPPTRTHSYQVEQASHEGVGPVQPVAHTEAIRPQADDAPLPLRTSRSPQRLTQESANHASGKRATTTVVGSLSVVLAAFFVLVWLSRKTAPKGLAPLPGEVFESLGRAPLTARQQMQLIRLGNKLVLLSVTSTGAETLTEITDVDEVNRLAALCQQGRSGSISDTFRQVLSQYADEPAPGGFVGDASLSQVEVANRTARRERRREDNRA
ncbi:MAG TPA: flagellar biosynthetic protein FliO [Pirellulaceae bacterium]|nr:flagellar biosynthetic protein FliO [Pirellulaceae bacterium]